jgi:hypothetical protein
LIRQGVGPRRAAAPNEEAPAIGRGFLFHSFEAYTTPWSSMASATFTKPAMLAPFT